MYVCMYVCVCEKEDTLGVGGDNKSIMKFKAESEEECDHWAHALAV